MKFCRLLRHIHTNAVYKFCWILTGALLAILKKQLFVSFTQEIMVALSEIKNITIVLSSQYCVIVEAAKMCVLLQLHYTTVFPYWILLAGCVILSIKAHLCLRVLKRKYILSDLHFIVDEKVKILHFHDKDKS